METVESEPSEEMVEGEAVVAKVVEEETEKSGNVVEAEAVVTEVMKRKKINQYLLIVLLFGGTNKLLFFD